MVFFCSAQPHEQGYVQTISKNTTTPRTNVQKKAILSNIHQQWDYVSLLGIILLKMYKLDLSINIHIASYYVCTTGHEWEWKWIARSHDRTIFVLIL
jgi:hypothetical protein